MDKILLTGIRTFQKRLTHYIKQKIIRVPHLHTQRHSSRLAEGSQVHRYNAAGAWALAGFADSAFFQLDNIATKSNYMNDAHIASDSALISLHQDKRWKPLLEIIKQNKEKADKAEAKLNKPLIAQLDTILKEDQNYRIQMDTIIKRYGWESPQMKANIALLNKADSVNLIEVKNILDEYGWLGPDVIGGSGNITLFLVIQHADQATQEKYLPMMREAAKNGKAPPGNLALLEDRVALGQGKKTNLWKPDRAGQRNKQLLYFTIGRSG